jgi:hypothetical protein
LLRERDDRRVDDADGKGRVILVDAHCAEQMVRWRRSVGEGAHRDVSHEGSGMAGTLASEEAVQLGEGRRGT